MRTDLNKVLCERERRGSKKSFKEYRRTKKFIADEGTNAESMTHRYGYDTKDFSEHLRPLEGLIRKNCGQHWDKFYSELCEVFDMKSVINQHILQHLYDYCSNTVYEDQGEYFEKSKYGHEPQALKSGGPEYFIHPKTKVITKNKHSKPRAKRNWKAEKAAELFKTERKLPDGTLLKAEAGIWYRITMEKYTVQERKYNLSKSSSSGEMVYDDVPVEYERVASKEQLNTKELIQYGLKG